jgi:hypothetical protein
MKAHFFDIETILVMNSKVWIVDKLNPKVPIIKISKSDFNLIKSGIYKSQNNSIYFGGTTYWVPEKLMNVLKIKCKNLKTDITNLMFSMQEYMNPDIIETLDYEINIENLQHLKNKTDDIYLICSKNTKNNYEKIIKKIEEKLEKIGLIVKKYYFISDTFYNRDLDGVAHKKVRLILQHLIGMKTEGDRFIEEEIEKYDEIEFYEDDENTIRLAIDCNNLLEILIGNSESVIKSKIKDLLKSETTLYVNYVSPNKVNRFSKTKVSIEYQLIKTFERFRYKNK